MNHILDAGPMIAYLDGEPGASIVSKILIDNQNQCFAYAFNLTEIYYIYFRRGGLSMAESSIQSLIATGVVPRQDIDELFWKEVGSFKGRHAMSLPDAFCLTLARRLNGVVVTKDHGEFDPLIPLGYCQILFIR